MNVILYTSDAVLTAEIEKLFTRSEHCTFTLTSRHSLPLPFKPPLLIFDMSMPERDRAELREIMGDDIILITDFPFYPEPQRDAQTQLLRYVNRQTLSHDMPGILLSFTPDLLRDKDYIEFLKPRSKEIKSHYRRRFWTDVLLEIIPQNPELLKKMADGILLESKYRSATPILIHIWNAGGGVISGQRQCFYVGSLAQQFIFGGDSDNIALNNEFILIINYTKAEPEFFIEACKSLADVCERTYSCVLSCYIGEYCGMLGMPLTVRKMEALDIDNVSTKSVVCMESSGDKMRSMPEEPPIELWNSLLSSGKFDELLMDATSFLSSQINTIDKPRQFLWRFTQDFTQLLYSALGQLGTPAHMLFGSDNSAERLKNAPDSLENALLWLHFSVSEFAAYISGRLSEKTAVSIVTDYIRANLHTPLKRDELAEQVHFSQGHLARIFKREIGIGISEYIMRERISLACKLMEQTNLLLNEIAEKVGYSNYSYFFTRFRAMTGLKPSEYRAEFSGKEREK